MTALTHMCLAAQALSYMLRPWLTKARTRLFSQRRTGIQQ